MYVTKADYKGRISTVLLDMLIAEDATGIIANASRSAEDTINSLAGRLYDIPGEFAKLGTARNHFVLNMGLSIALYTIYQISDDEEVPEKVIKNYDDTINDLTKISTGKMTLNLPPAVVEDESDPGDGETSSTTGLGSRRLGSAPKRSHRI